MLSDESDLVTPASCQSDPALNTDENAGHTADNPASRSDGIQAPTAENMPPNVQEAAVTAPTHSSRLIEVIDAKKKPSKSYGTKWYGRKSSNHNKHSSYSSSKGKLPTRYQSRTKQTKQIPPQHPPQRQNFRGQSMNFRSKTYPGAGSSNMPQYWYPPDFYENQHPNAGGQSYVYNTHTPNWVNHAGNY